MIIGYNQGCDSNLWSIGSQLAFGGFVSFHALPLLDKSGYSRMRKKNRWSKLVFHEGNFILHIIPCIVILRNPPVYKIIHSILANVIHLVWAILSSGSIHCDNVYIPLESYVWRILWTLALITEWIPVQYYSYIISIIILNIINE